MSFARKLTVSRNVILEMLSERDVNTEAYNNFSVEELNVLYKNSTKSSKEMNPLWNCYYMEMSGEKNTCKIFV